MLRKCLRYDFKSILPYWLFGSVTLFLMSIFAGIAKRSSIFNSGNYDRFNWEPFVILLFYGLLVAYVILSAVLVFSRFQNHFFSDEGYLTFTLPVKRRVLYTSKVINGVIWYILTTLVINVSNYVMSLFTVSFENDTDFSSTILFSGLKPVWRVLCFIEVYLISFISMFTFIIFIYFIITLGATIAKKNRAITSIGLGYGLSVAFVLVIYLIALLCVMYLFSAMVLFPGGVSYSGALFFSALGLLGVVLLTVTILMAYLNLHLIERKLNLA